MRFEFYGISFETPRVTFYLWSPWRCTLLEHKLFGAVQELQGVRREDTADECAIHVDDAKTARAALVAASRVLKGWQEEAEMGTDRRTWRWLMDGDSNGDGFDHNGERFSLWAILRVSLDRGGPVEGEKGEDVDLEGFGLRVWPELK